MESMGKRPRRRRSFTPEFKAEIVELCQRGDRTVGAGRAAAGEPQAAQGHPEAGDGFLREGDPVNCYPFIEAGKSQRRNVKRACELLKVSGPPTTQRATAGPRTEPPGTPSCSRRSRRSTRNRKGVTVRRGSTLSCAPRAGGTPASGSPG
jgi:hypothetical protein